MKCHFEVNYSLTKMKKKHRILHQPNTCVELTLLILLLSHHRHRHGGLGAWLCSPQWQPADLQRAEIALQSVFGGGVPLLHILLPFCWSHPVVHLKAHQFRLTCRTTANNQKGRYGEMYCCTNRVQASGKNVHSNEIFFLPGAEKAFSWFQVYFRQPTDYRLHWQIKMDDASPFPLIVQKYELLTDFLEFLVWRMSYLISLRRRGLWPILKPTTRRRLRCFGVTC